MARVPTNESRQYKRDKKDQEKHVRKAGVEFKKLLKTLQPYADSAKVEHPGRDKGSISRRARAFVKLVKNNPIFLEYLDTYIGKEADHPKAYSWRSAILYQARDVLTKGKTIRDALVEVHKQAFKGFQAITMAEAQGPMREVLPTELRDFLPDNIVVDVDENGQVQGITDRFENEHLTLGKKIDKMHNLIRDYNQIAKQVKRDLKSGDEVIKLSALITAIMMETGIRPGKEGNAAIKTVNGEKVEIETFGAITLGPSHVRFIRDNFAELEFLGKKGGHNFASLTDAEIIKILKAQTDKAKGGKFIFVTSKGQRVTYSDLQRYFRERFKDVSPTDFRKLRATEAVLDALRDEQAALFDRIKAFSTGAKTDLKQRVVEAIVETLNRAIDVAQAALSHDSANTTRKSYINPEIILRFLSTASVEDSLERAVLQGRPTLSFDPELFMNKAMGKVGSSSPTGATSLQDILDELEDELAEAGIKTSQDRVTERYLLKLSAQKVAHRYAMEHATEEAMKKHLRDHPNAKERDHKVKSQSGGGSGGGSAPSKAHLSAAGVPEGTKLPASTAKAIQTKEGQEAVSQITDEKKSKSLAKKILEHANPVNIIKKLAGSTVREVRNVAINTPTILMDCIKEGRVPSSEKKKWPKGCDAEGSKTECSEGEASERDVLYGSAIYAGGIAVATGVGIATGGISTAGGFAAVGGKAFLNSLTLHIGIGAYTAVGDKMLLHAEGAQDVATLAGGSMAEAVGNYGTGALGGIGSAVEWMVNAVSTIASTEIDTILEDKDMIRLAKEGKSDELYEQFVGKIVEYAHAKFDKGLTQEEIKSILEHEGV